MKDKKTKKWRFILIVFLFFNLLIVSMISLNEARADDEEESYEEYEDYQPAEIIEEVPVENIDQPILENIQPEIIKQEVLESPQPESVPAIDQAETENQPIPEPAIVNPNEVFVDGNLAQDLASQERGDILFWHITRASAISAYVFMFFLIFMGETMTTGVLYGAINPVSAWTIHKYVAVSFAFAIFIHVVSLLLDKFINFSILDVLIPFYSDYKPFFLSLGIVALYLLFVIMLSSIISRFQKSSWWRSLHFLTYPLFILGFIHGIMIGTDSGNIFMIILYWFTGAIFLLLLLHRWKFRQERYS